MLNNIETRSGIVMSYKEYKKMSVTELVIIPAGTLVKGVEPCDLLASQNWLYPSKVVRACRDIRDGSCQSLIRAYPINWKEKPRLVIGDGHHRAAIIFVNELGKVDVLLEQLKYKLPGIWPLPTIANKFLDLLTGILDV